MAIFGELDGKRRGNTVHALRDACSLADPHPPDFRSNTAHLGREIVAPLGASIAQHRASHLDRCLRDVAERRCAILELAIDRLLLLGRELDEFFDEGDQQCEFRRQRGKQACCRGRVNERPEGRRTPV